MSRSLYKRLSGNASEPASPRSEAGVTLIELLVTVVILGIAFAVIVGGMMTSIIGSDVHRKGATAGTVLQSYAEAVKAAQYTPAPSSNCSAAMTAAYGTPAGFSAPTGFTPSIGSFGYWNSTTSTFGTACPASDAGLQKMQLTVTAPNGTTKSVSIVKRLP
ncbi:MAG: type IV pilus modification PilV family protein [Actinomycetota bacterium]